MAVISSGPLGVIAGAVLGVLVALVGKGSVESVVRKLRVPLLMRLLVLDSAVTFGLAQQKKKIEASVIRELSDPANGFAGRLCAALSRTVGAQLEDMAKNAEMSIEA